MLPTFVGRSLFFLCNRNSNSNSNIHSNSNSDLYFQFGSGSLDSMSASAFSIDSSRLILVHWSAHTNVTQSTPVR
jgi:hypothetical protein